MGASAVSKYEVHSKLCIQFATAQSQIITETTATATATGTTATFTELSSTVARITGQQ